MSFVEIVGRQFYFSGSCACCWVCANQENLTETVNYLVNGQGCGDTPPVTGLFLRGEFDDLSPIRRLIPPVTNLRLESHVLRKRDLECLYAHQYLSTFIHEETECGLDFSAFPFLRSYSGYWHTENTNLVRCRNLSQVTLRRLNTKSKTLIEIEGLAGDALEITHTNIESLDGIGAMEDLLKLSISYAPKLQSWEGLTSLADSLRALEIDHAKKIRELEKVACFGELRELRLVHCSRLKSLSILRGLRKLRWLSVADTDIDDGDFSPLLLLPELISVGMTNKKHYSHRNTELNEMLKVRNTLDILI